MARSILGLKINACSVHPVSGSQALAGKLASLPVVGRCWQRGRLILSFQVSN
jgi:hypothetical protein